jgi:hypothetical protein
MEFLILHFLKTEAGEPGRRCDTLNTCIQWEGDYGNFDQACAGALTPAASVGCEDGAHQGFLSAGDD